MDRRIDGSSAVVACDAARRARVLRRVGGRDRITDADAFGRSVVWGEAVQRRRSARAIVVEARLDGRIRHRRTVWRGRDAGDVNVDVAALRREVVAWTQRRTALLARPGRRPVRLTPPYGGFLVAEDGRTLGWETPRADAVFRDVLPVPLRRGCPARSAFETVSAGAQVRVRAAEFRSQGPALRVVRVCLPAERRDVVVAASGYEVFRELTSVTARWAAVTASPFSMSQNFTCDGQHVELVDLRDGRVHRAAGFADCDSAPDDEDMQALTPAGRLAWLHAGILRATGPGGGATELDRGAIAGLRADGETFRWSNAGEPRDAPAP